MTNPLQLRKMIREVLSALPPGRRLTVDGIRALLNRREDVPEPADVDTVGEQLGWNFRKGLVDFEMHPELEREEWRLTPRGEALEEVDDV